MDKVTIQIRSVLSGTATVDLITVWTAVFEFTLGTSRGKGK